jgi:polyisoprenoid-binding protein YceI
MTASPFHGALACALLSAAGAQAAFADAAYTIDPESSIPSFEVRHLGFTTQHGRFTRVNGRIELDQAAHRGSVDFTIDTTSLEMGSAAWTMHLLDEGLFNSARFPTMTFHSTTLQFENDRVIGADGTLTMLGVTKPVHLEVEHFRCGPHPVTKRPLCGGDIKAKLHRSEFGLVKYQAVVSDEVEVEAPVIAYRD